MVVGLLKEIDLEENKEVYISVGNVHSSVIADKTVLKLLEDNFAYEVEDASYIRDAKIKFYLKENRPKKAKEWAEWNGKFSVFNYSKFGTGILGDVIMFLEDEGYIVEVIDQMDKGYTFDEFEDYGKQAKDLYEYQQKAKDSLCDNDYRGILGATTAFGKTVVACDIIKDLKKKTIIIVDKTEIMEEWIDEIPLWFDFVEDKIKGVSGRIWYAGSEPMILLCTSRLLQSVMSRKHAPKTMKTRNRMINDFIKNAGLLIYDEAHHAAAKQSRKVISKIPAYHRIGLTATPNMREDNADYEYLALLGNVNYHFTPTELVESGRGAEIEIEFLSPVYDPDWFQSIQAMNSYQDMFEAYIVNNEERNNVILQTVLKEVELGNSVMVLVDRVAHARFLSSQLGDDIASFTWAGDDKDERRQKVEDFKAGKTPAFFCTYSLGGEGFDYPELNALILAGGRSETKIRQSLGRIMRPKKDGSNATLYDFADTINPFRDHFIDRIKVYKSEEVFRVTKMPGWVRKYV